MRLSTVEIARLAREAMGPDASTRDVATSTAIALCESGGETTAQAQAVNAIANGLWQQNEGIGEGLFDPQVAARHMATTWRASGWRYWGCGPDHGAGYLEHMPEALAAAAAAGSGGSPSEKQCMTTFRSFLRARGGDPRSPSLDDISAFGIAHPECAPFLRSDPFGGIPGLGAVKSLGEAVAFMTDPHNWLRLGEAMAGGAMVGVGLVMMAYGTRAGRQAIRGAAHVASKGRV